MNIHFFGGIHGVGKTFLCKRLSSQLSIKHFSAGELINQGIQKNKEVKSINSNQNVPKDIYYEMNITKMFLVVCEIHHIQDRILARDNKQYDIDLLYKMQEAEIKRYKELCKYMGFEEHIIDTTNNNINLDEIKLI